jgi:hypothetical protein
MLIPSNISPFAESCGQDSAKGQTRVVAEDVAPQKKGITKALHIFTLRGV